MIVLRLEATLDVGVITRLVGGNYKVAALLGSQSSALCPIQSKETESRFTLVQSPLNNESLQ